MTCHLEWTRPPAATALHLLRTLSAGGTLHDQRLQQALTPLAQSMPHPRLEPELWSDAIGQTSKVTEAEVAGQPAWLHELSQQAVAAIAEVSPRWHDELSHRQRPLKDQWLARGPGFLKQLERSWLGERLSTEHISLICLLPASGGFGEIHPKQDAVSWESVLTNVDDGLPELARLAFLITDLQLAKVDPEAEVVPRQLIALLITLRLADELEWFTVSPLTFATAVSLWQIDAECDQEDLARVLYERCRTAESVTAFMT